MKTHILKIEKMPHVSLAKVFQYSIALQTVGPDQLASSEGSALFVIQYVHLYQQSGSNILIG